MRLFGLRSCDVVVLRVLVDALVMAPKREFCEPAMALRTLVFIRLVPASMGHRQRAAQA